MAKGNNKPGRKRTGRTPRVVGEEERLLRKVHTALDNAPGPAATLEYDRELVRLRDALAEERLADDRAMLLDQMDHLASLSETRSRYLPGRVDPDTPYFAHLAYTPEGQPRRDVLLGKKTFLHDGVRIVDWRHAPISRIFYRYTEGDDFIEEIAGREMTGRVGVRRTVTIVGGRLVRVAGPRRVYLRTSAGWEQVADDRTALAGGAGTATRPDTVPAGIRPFLGDMAGVREHRQDKRLPEIAALLDGEQFDVLTREGQSLLVVAGGAGSGKTTVGLHRLAYLAFQDPGGFRPKRMQVIVFGPALARYIDRVLPALGVQGVPVATLGDWALRWRQRHFPGLPRKTCRHTPAAVVRFKTHRALVPMLEEAAHTAPDTEPPILFDELFTDRGWMRRGIERYAPGAFSPGEIDAVHRWCTDQQFRRFDGAAPDDEDPPCYDEEDNMILLRLYQLSRGRLMYGRKRKLAYDHLMVDEAQDFSPLEIQVLLDTVPGGSVTLAGDAAQKITGNDFGSWSEMLQTIGQQDFAVTPLRVSYRSTREITEVARAVLGPLAPDEPLETVRRGAPVELLRFGSRGETMTFLGDSLADLSRREPSASVAVLTRTAEQADEAHASLARTGLEGLRRVREQDFSFGPGFEICEIAATRGLEFDYVVLLGTDAQTYPATPNSRHLMHVGATRAIHQLWLLSWAPRSPILPTWLEERVGG